MTDTILELSTLVTRKTIKLSTSLHPEGRLYELRGGDELGLLEHETIAAKRNQLQTLAALKGKPTVAQDKRLDSILADLVTTFVIDIEAKVVAELSRTHRFAILTAWSNQQETAEGNAPAGRPSTGAGSSRASRRSTAAPRKRGSTSRSGS